MSTSEHPITLGELREELDRTLKHYATRAEVAFMVLAGVGAASSIVAFILRFTSQGE